MRLDFYSDTKTRPTPCMRQAMASAAVGDEQHLEDPTVLQLIERSKSLLGQEDAVFLPTGTMANLISVLVHCQPGDEVIGHETSHVFDLEGGNLAAVGGVMVRRICGRRGTFTAEEVHNAVRSDNGYSRYASRSKLLVVEQTANLAGGTVWPLEQLTSVVNAAKVRGLATHMDGARLMNASVASGHTPSSFARQFDSVYFDFTKGLGAPVGAVLAGSEQFIQKAWLWKQRLGGAMRQAGVLAAACLHGLDEHTGKIAEDHAHARMLAAGLAEIDGLVVAEVETNIVFFDVADTGHSAEDINTLLRPHGLRFFAAGPTRLRAVTHLDISTEMVLEAIGIVKDLAHRAWH